MAYNNGGKAPKKPIINQFTGEGIVKTISANDGDEIKFVPFQNGGGAIKFTLACTEEVPGMNDENGQPKSQTDYIPVKVITNKNITAEQLKSVVPGMRVRVVGKNKVESYVSKKNNTRVSTMIVYAYVFEILQMPAQNYGQPQGYQQGGYQQPQGGYPAPGSYPQYPPQGGYPGPQGAYPGQPGMPYPPAPGYPAPGGYPQYPQPGAQPYYQRPAGPAGPAAPAYGRPAGQGAQQPAQQAPAPQTQAPQGQAGAQPVPPYFVPGQGGAGPQGGEIPPPNYDDFPPGN